MSTFGRIMLFMVGASLLLALPLLPILYLYLVHNGPHWLGRLEVGIFVHKMNYDALFGSLFTVGCLMLVTGGTCIIKTGILE